MSFALKVKKFLFVVFPPQKNLAGVLSVGGSVLIVFFFVVPVFSGLGEKYRVFAEFVLWAWAAQIMWNTRIEEEKIKRGKKNEFVKI